MVLTESIVNITFDGVIKSREPSSISEIAGIYYWVVYSVVCQIIVIFGVGSNIINIICFVKQGFKDPVNVSLLGMAVSDLGSLMTLFWTNISLNPAFRSLDLPFDALEVQYLISGMPHTTFTCITAWITALITLERCFCITSPLKVKTVVTSKRVAITIVCVFITIMSGQVPFYVVNRLGMKYYPHINKTLIGHTYTKDRDRVESMSFRINNFALPFCAFLIIVVCTITIVMQLKMHTKWRTTKATSSANVDKVSNRNQKVAQMVIMISTLFIVCFIPTCIICIAMSLLPAFTFGGNSQDLIFMVGGLGVILESTNSSANIFIYYHMSSKYKNTFQRLFLEARTKINI